MDQEDGDSIWRRAVRRICEARDTQQTDDPENRRILIQLTPQAQNFVKRKGVVVTEEKPLITYNMTYAK